MCVCVGVLGDLGTGGPTAGGGQAFIKVTFTQWLRRERGTDELLQVEC